MSEVLAWTVNRCSPLSSSLGALLFFPLDDLGVLAIPRVCVMDSETGTARIASRSSLEVLEEGDAVTTTAESRKKKEMTVREEERIIVDAMEHAWSWKSKDEIVWMICF